MDIQMLNDRGQRPVFGRSMRALSNMLERGDLDLDVCCEVFMPTLATGQFEKNG
jgi:hypothetical protein